MELLGNQMAAANLIREALMALLKAKKSNVSAQGTKNQIRKQGFDDFDDSSPRNPDAIELADDAAENLQRTRQQAQEAQGTDRLANPIDMEDFGNTQLNRDPRNPANTWHDGDRAPVEFYRRTENINSPNLKAPLGGLSRAEGRMTLPPEIAQQLKGIEDDIGKGAGIKEVLDRLATLDDAGYHKYTDDIIDRLLSQTKTPDVSDIPF